MAVSAEINVMRNEDCPKCGAGIQVADEFRKWCPSCEWNMGENASEFSSSRIERIYDKIGTRQGSKLFDWIKNQQPDQLRPRWTGSKITAFVLASLVHLISLSLLGLGIWFLSFGWPAILMMLIGVVLIGMAWFMRPRFGRMPEGCLTREEAPELFKLCDRIADQVGSPKVAGILIDGDYNAAFARVGLPRKTLLVIGLPLWLQESWPERIGTLSHEFSHGANGDSSRGLYVGSALNSLEELMSFLRPEYDPDNGISGMLAHYAMWLASVPFALLHLALSHLLWRQSQIAEFLADYLATTASGTKAMKASLRNNSFGEHFFSFMRKNHLQPPAEGPGYFGPLCEFHGKSACAGM